MNICIFNYQLNNMKVKKLLKNIEKLKMSFKIPIKHIPSNLKNKFFKDYLNV